MMRNRIEIHTEKNILRYYHQAGKLQIALPDWEDAEGQWRRGKMVTLDLKAVAVSEGKDAAREVFQMILRGLE
jgi:hypothetical protein